MLSAVVAITAFLGISSAQAAGEKYILVSHAPDSDSWWNTIKMVLLLQLIRWVLKLNTAIPLQEI